MIGPRWSSFKPLNIRVSANNNKSKTNSQKMITKINLCNSNLKNCFKTECRNKSNKTSNLWTLDKINLLTSRILCKIIDKKPANWK